MKFEVPAQDGFLPGAVPDSAVRESTLSVIALTPKADGHGRELQEQFRVQGVTWGFFTI